MNIDYFDMLEVISGHLILEVLSRNDISVTFLLIKV